MAGFQAVDLDSILDEFESEQNEAEKDNESSNASKSEVEDKHKENLFGPRHGLNLYEQSQTHSKDGMQPNDTFLGSSDCEENIGDNDLKISNQESNEINRTEVVASSGDEEFMLNGSSMISKPVYTSSMHSSLLTSQPDVLSGLENVVDTEDISTPKLNSLAESSIISNNIEEIKDIPSAYNEAQDDHTELNPHNADQNTIKLPVSPNSESTPSFESIYDKYRSKDTDTDDERVLAEDLTQPTQKTQYNDTQNVKQNYEFHSANSNENHDIENKNPNLLRPLSYEQADVSQDELTDMLEQLETSDLMNQSKNQDCLIPVESHNIGGARPKDTSFKSSNIACSAVDIGESQIDSFQDESTQDMKPDIVVATNKENDDSNIKGGMGLRRSPPPYCEIDPMVPQETEKYTSNEKFDRPTSLNLEISKSETSDIPTSPTAESESERDLALAIENSLNDNCAVQTTQSSSINENDDERDALVPIVGPPGSTPANPNGPSSAGIPELLQGMSEEQLMLGKVSPFWIPDTEASSCMICDTKFTIVKRRHHCRACGKVLCASCCSEKVSLPCLEGKEGRVCTPCKGILDRLQRAEHMANAHGNDNGITDNLHPPVSASGNYSLSNASGGSRADPSLSAAVPVSVLKRPEGAAGTPGSSAGASSTLSATGEAKQVMFSDGIRPGGDLTELDGPDPVHRPPKRSGSRGSSKKHRREHRDKTNSLSSGEGSLGAKKSGASDFGEVVRSMMPSQGLPYVSGQGPVGEDILIPRFDSGNAVPFSLNRNLRVYVTLVKCYSPINKPLWNYKTQGLSSVGQDEIVILLVQSAEEKTPHRNIFDHLQQIYEQAAHGRHFSNMDHSVISGKEFLDKTEYGGFLFIRHTFQCIDDLDLPTQQPFLFGILLTKWEMPWARVFPLRLLLRLGAECRYYPSPLWSIRGRNTVYKEIGNTIMKLLSDFRNFTYSLPIIRGMVIHMEDKITTVIIPKNSYSQIQRALQNSNDPVLALGSNFSSSADSHLVAVQRDEDTPSRNPLNNSDYETQAINIANKSRKVTGASFLVLNGALKSSSGLSAKSSIVEDGIMVQVSQDRMMEIRKALNKMSDVKIGCGPISAGENEPPDETVYIKWTEKNPSINAGRKSLVDGRPMDGISSIKMMQGGPDYASKSHMIKWTEVFILPSSKECSENADFNEPPDPSRITSHIAKAISMALLPHLKQLKKEDLSPLAVKVCLDPENTSYEAGSKGVTLPAEFMNNLDNELVPIIHGQSSPSANSYELIFHILDI